MPRLASGLMSSKAATYALDLGMRNRQCDTALCVAPHGDAERLPCLLPQDADLHT